MLPLAKGHVDVVVDVVRLLSGASDDDDDDDDGEWCCCNTV
jgi:hypothetical protein